MLPISDVDYVKHRHSGHDTCRAFRAVLSACGAVHRRSFYVDALPSIGLTRCGAAMHTPVRSEHVERWVVLVLPLKSWCLWATVWGVADQLKDQPAVGSSRARQTTCSMYRSLISVVISGMMHAVIGKPPDSTSHTLAHSWTMGEPWEAGKAASCVGLQSGQIRRFGGARPNFLRVPPPRGAGGASATGFTARP